MRASPVSRRVALVAASAVVAALVVLLALTAFARRPAAPAPEYLSTASSSFAEQAVAWFPTWVTLPAGYEKSTFGFAVAQRLRPEHPVYLTRLAVQADFERYSRCLWLQDWMSADVSNDLDGMTSAAVVLRRSATWPATVATASRSVTGLQHLARSAAELELAPVSREFSTRCPPLPATSTN